MSVVWALATVVAYLVASQLAARGSARWLHPVLVAAALLVVALRATGTSLETYARGGRAVSAFLAPAVVALALPLADEVPRLGSRLWRAILAVASGAAVGVLGVLAIARIFSTSPVVTASLLPKSTTSGFAIAIAERLHGSGPLAAAIVIVVGVFGASVLPWILRRLGVKDPLALGLGLGTAAHGVGTARAAEEGPAAGAASAFGMALAGVVTALLAAGAAAWLGGGMLP